MEDNHFDFRPGYPPIPTFGGVVKQRDPAAIPLGHFQGMTNVRIHPGQILARYGQATAVSASVSAAVIGLFDTGAFSAPSQSTI